MLKKKKKIQARVYWGSCAGCKREQKQVTGFLAPSHGMEEGKLAPLYCPLYRVRVGTRHCNAYAGFL